MPKAAKAIIGFGAVIYGTITGNPAAIKFGYALIISNALDIIAQALISKPRLRRLGQDIEYSGTVEQRRIIYGQMKVSGMNVIPPWTSGTNNQNLHQVLALAGHEVSAITDIYFGQEVIDGDASPQVITPVTGTASDGLVLSGTYANRAWIRRYLGTTSQTADYILDTAFTDWTSSHRGRGVAYLAIQFQLDDAVYKSGKPEVSCIVQGKKCYDPRLDVSPGASPTNASYIAYTTNPALCLADYMIDTTIGLGEATTRIDWDLVVAAANICDEDVVIPPSASPSTTQNRYTCSVVLAVAVTDEEMRDNISTLVQAMMGHICYRGGKWRMYAGAAVASSFTLTEADIVGKVSIRTEVPANEKYNYVRGQFVDAARNYQLSEFEPRGNSSYETADGVGSPISTRRYPREVVFAACTNQYEAQRNAIVVLKRSRRKLQATLSLGMSAFRIRPWDVGTLTLDELGWDAQLVRCVSWTFNPQGTIEATFLEELATDWDDPAIGDYSAPSVGAGPNAGTYIPDPVENLVLTPLVDAILLNWNRADSNPVGTMFNVFQADTSSPRATFASATRIYSRLTSTSHFVPRTDETTKDYWVTAQDRFSGNQSEETPQGFGLAGAPLSITVGFRLSVDRATHFKTLVSTGSGTTTNTSTVTPIENVGSVTYSWVRTSGSTKISVVSSTSATTGFSATGLADQEQVTAVFTCTGTDTGSSPNGIATISVSVTFFRDDSFGS